MLTKSMFRCAVGHQQWHVVGRFMIRRDDERTVAARLLGADHDRRAARPERRPADRPDGVVVEIAHDSCLRGSCHREATRVRAALDRSGRMRARVARRNARAARCVDRGAIPEVEAGRSPRRTRSRLFPGVRESTNRCRSVACVPSMTHGTIGLPARSAIVQMPCLIRPPRMASSRPLRQPPSGKMPTIWPSRAQAIAVRIARTGTPCRLTGNAFTHRSMEARIGTR